MPSQYPPPPRDTPSEYRREIEQVKRSIASMKKNVESLTEAVNSNHAQFITVMTRDPPLAAAIMQQMTLSTEQINLFNQQINLDTQRLIQLETRVEEEAKKKARVSHKSGFGQEGPDSVYISDIAKFQVIQTWLDKQRVLLLRSPPGSGKTSFAIRFTDHLVEQGFSVVYVNASARQSTKRLELDEQHYGTSNW